MSAKMTKGTFTVSMAVGALLVPLSAVAAIWLAGPAEGSDDPTVEPTAATVAAPTTAVVANSAMLTLDDLMSACGPEGLQLVDLETAGDITDVQQAALDGLRDVCAQAGMPLPAAPVPDPIVQTIVLPAAATATTMAVSNDSTQSEYEDDDYEDDRYEEDDHEDREHEADHEDDDHESGEHERSDD